MSMRMWDATSTMISAQEQSSPFGAPKKNMEHALLSTIVTELSSVVASCDCFKQMLNFPAMAWLFDCQNQRLCDTGTPF